MIVFQSSIRDDQVPFRIFKTDLIDFPLHWHDDYEIIYNLGDSLKMTLGDQAYTLEKGDILLASPQKVHAFLSQPLLSERIIIQFQSDLVSRFKGNIHFRTPLIKSDGYLLGENRSIYKDGLHKKIEDLIFQLRHNSDLKRMSILYDLLDVLVENLEFEKINNKGCQKRILKLERVVDFVNEHFDKPIDLGKVSALTDYSTYHFTKFFKEMTGMTFKTYLNNFRVEKACVNLSKTNESITEVSMNAGFNSIKTFNRVFKDFKGCSPKAYRSAINEASRTKNDMLNE